MDEQDDVGSPDADVVKFAVDSEGHGAGLVDAIVSDFETPYAAATSAWVRCSRTTAVMIRRAFDMDKSDQRDVSHV